MDCTLCNTPLIQKADDYFFICSTCGAYVKNFIHYVSSDLEKSRYEEHNNDVNDTQYQNFTSPVTNAILKDFDESCKGLDYGCGTGPVITETLRKNGYSVKLYDPFFYPDTKPLEDQYDYIICCEVFEHFYHPAEEIIKLKTLLKPNGRLYIMTHLYEPEIYFKNWYYRNDSTHVFIATFTTMKYIENEFDMKIVEMNNRLIIFEK